METTNVLHLFIIWNMFFFTPTLSGSWNDYLCEQEKYEANITNF